PAAGLFGLEGEHFGQIRMDEAGHRGELVLEARDRQRIDGVLAKQLQRDRLAALSRVPDQEDRPHSSLAQRPDELIAMIEECLAIHLRGGEPFRSKGVTRDGPVDAWKVLLMY